MYDYLDGKWLNHALRRPEAERLRMRKADIAIPDMPKEGLGLEEGRRSPSDLAPLKGWRPSKIACFTVGTQLCCMIVIAWTVSLTSLAWGLWLMKQLYIVYSIGT